MENLMHATVVPDLPEYDEKECPILEEFRAADAGPDFRQMADRLIECYRRAPIEYAKRLRIGNRVVPAADSNGRMLWIHYGGPEGSFRRVSLASVIDGRAPPSAFAGKVVILGVTAQGAGDRVFTPFSAGLGMSGIEVHANIFSTLLDGAYLSPLSPPVEFLSFLVIAALIATAAWWQHGRCTSFGG